MALESGISEKLAFYKACGDINEQIKVSIKTDVESEQIKRVVSVVPEARLNKKEIIDGSLRVTGVVTFYICYINFDGEIKKCECGNSFDTKITLTEKVDKCLVRLSIDKSEVDLSGINLSVVAYVNVRAKCEREETTHAIMGGEDFIIKRKEIEYPKCIGVVEGSLPLSEEIEVDYVVNEIIMQRANAVVTSSVAGVGVVIVDGVVYFSTILLQSGEKKDIMVIRKSIPFRFEIECEEAMPNYLAQATAFIKTLKTDVSVDEEKKVSLLNVETVLRVEAECVSLKTMETASDLFSLTNEVSLKRFSFECLNKGEMRSIIKSINTVVGLDDSVKEIVCVNGENAEVLSYSITENGILATGVLSFHAFYLNQEGEPVCKRLETPFEENLGVIENLSECKISVCLTNLTIEKQTSEQLETRFECVFSLYPAERRQVGIITEANLGELKTPPKYPLSVYIGKANEEEWDLAKRLNVTPTELIETNKELCFPLTGEERIVVYRQKK